MKFKPTVVTQFEFTIAGGSEKNIKHILDFLKKNNIGSVSVKSGKLVKKELVELEHDSGHCIHNTNLSEFIGVRGKGKENHIVSGLEVSKMKINKEVK